MKYFLPLCFFILMGCENIVNVYTTSWGTGLTRKYDFSSQPSEELAGKLVSEYTTVDQKRDILVEFDGRTTEDVNKMSNREKNGLISAAVEVACSNDAISDIFEKIKFKTLDRTEVKTILDALPHSDSFVGVNAIARFMTDDSYLVPENLTSLSLGAAMLMAHTVSWLQENRKNFNEDGTFFNKFRDYMEGTDVNGIFVSSGLDNPPPGSTDEQVKKNLVATLDLMKKMFGFDGFSDSVIGKLFQE